MLFIVGECGWLMARKERKDASVERIGGEGHVHHPASRTLERSTVIKQHK